MFEIILQGGLLAIAVVWASYMIGEARSRLDSMRRSQELARLVRDDHVQSMCEHARLIRALAVSQGNASLVAACDQMIAKYDPTAVGAKQ